MLGKGCDARLPSGETRPIGRSGILDWKEPSRQPFQKCRVGAMYDMCMKKKKKKDFENASLSLLFFLILPAQAETGEIRNFFGGCDPHSVVLSRRQTPLC